MKRIEAEHLLDAYVLTIDLFGNKTKEAENSLREVILDAMTNEMLCPYNLKSWPYIDVKYKSSTNWVNNG